MRSRLARLMAIAVLALLAGMPAMAPVSVGAQLRAQEVHFGATFQFDPGVSELDKFDVIEGIRLGQIVIADYLGVSALPNLRIYVLGDAASGDDSTLATTWGSEIEIYTGSPVWRSLTPVERVVTVVHELVHVYQNLMIIDALDVELLWFAEGTADAIGFQAILPLAVTNQDEIYNMMSYLLTKYPVTISLSAFEGFDSMDADAYPLAYVAVQYLLGSRGLSVVAIGDVYDGLAAGQTFAASFQQAFGVSLADFYSEFDAWRLSFVKTRELDDDFRTDDVVSTVSGLTLAHVTGQVPSSGQLAVTGQTTPLVACELAIAIGTGIIQRPAESNGAGEVYWLVSMPEGTVPGSGTFTASCGGSPVSGSFAIAG